MAVLGKVIKRALALSSLLERFETNPSHQQHKQLLQLIMKARNTEFGHRYKFEHLLKHPEVIEDHFRAFVPIHDYDKIHQEWWHRCLKDEPNICWPGVVHHYALSSGTSGSPSKFIPVTDEMVTAIQNASIKQIFSFHNFDLHPITLQKSILILGGSTHLNRRGRHFVGDMSGISAKQIPFWFQHYYKPGKKIAGMQDWKEKIAHLVREAPDWDIGIIAGIPAWIQLMFEQIISTYNCRTIHDIWPNLEVFVHGGVAFAPYRKSFQKLTGKPLVYIETYIASEGYVAFQKAPNENMSMIFNNGVYFEFIPFDEHNFRADGGIKPNAHSLKISEVEPNKPYALLMSTCAGAWRYLVGDVIRFTDEQCTKLVIDGRTKHYLNLCGEHLSVMNMTDAVRLVEEQTMINIGEFTVAPITDQGRFGHHWFIGTDDIADEQALSIAIDQTLQELNDDYRLERSSALQTFILTCVPVSHFYKWMEKEGKLGSQNKFPRVLQPAQYERWLAHLAHNKG